jgi:hypothetical protein
VYLSTVSDTSVISRFINCIDEDDVTLGECDEDDGVLDELEKDGKISGELEEDAEESILNNHLFLAKLDIL